jgi:hypothetical protein
VDAVVEEAEGLGATEDIGAWLANVRDDPVRFVMEGFPWGSGELAGSAGPEPWQLSILQEIKAGLEKPGEAIKIAVASGHGSGKSALAVWVTLFCMASRADTRGFVTASSENMLFSRYRAELKTWLRRFRAEAFFELGATTLLSRDPGHAQTWRIDMTPWSETRSETLAGLHNKGRTILAIFDEASAIAPIVWETVEACVTDADATVVWLALGNPLHPVGRFKDCFDKYAHRWITRHIDSRTISFTNKVELQRWIEDYGADSDFVRTRILGEFPRVGSTQFISPAMVDEAMERELTPSYIDPLVIGIDVARFGSDESVIFPRRGMDCRSIAPLTFRGIPLDALEDRVVNFCNMHSVQEILVDGGGVGGGLVDHLRRRGYLVHDIQFGSRADQQIDGVRYANKRAEIWGLMRNALRYLCLPNSQTLKEQLCGPEYSFSRTSDAILLEPKDAMKRRGLPSPDWADALAVTFGAELATLPRLAPWVQGQNVVSEYEPFDREHLQPPAEAGRAFVDSESGYAFRMKSEEWSSQDHQDVWASERLRFGDQGG